MIGVVPCIDSSVLLTESEAWHRKTQSNKSFSETTLASKPALSNNQIAINSPLCEKKSILNESVLPMDSTIGAAAFSQGSMKFHLLFTSFMKWNATIMLWTLVGFLLCWFFNLENGFNCPVWKNRATFQVQMVRKGSSYALFVFLSFLKILKKLVCFELF